MKKLLFVLYFMACGIALAQQVKLTITEKDLVGEWSIHKTPHSLTNISGTECLLTFILNADHKVKSLQKFTRNGKEVVSTSESGTWKITGTKLLLSLSGKVAISHGGIDFTGYKYAVSTIASSSGLTEKEEAELKKLNAKPRTLSLYIKSLESNTLHLSINDKFGTVFMFEKTYGDPTIIDVPAGNLTGSEKNLIGSWSFNNPDHMMKDQIPGSESICTFDFKDGRKFGFSELLKKKGKELTTTFENGTWGVKEGKLIIHFSGKWNITRGGKDLPLSGKTKSIPRIEQPRVIKYYYKIEGNDLLLSIHKDDFTNAAKYKKN